MLFMMIMQYVLTQVNRKEKEMPPKSPQSVQKIEAWDSREMEADKENIPSFREALADISIDS